MSDVLLAQKWSDEDPTGWWVSEKLDGVRALWRHGEFVSRGDNAFVCPDWFKRGMPADCVLDGELWGGRRQFQKTAGIVKSAARAKEWEFLTYMVFDALQDGGASIEGRPFEERSAALRRICERGRGLKAVPMERCAGREHLQELLGDVERRGGEGLMLRKPGSPYEHRRSHTLLKVKSFHDEEARVIGHDGGKGRLAGMCGALRCETPDGRKFKVGTGLSDAQRRDPPKINAVITYRYQELTVANIPRFPTLVAERVDMEWRQVCAEYVPPGPRLESALKKQHTVLFGDAGSAGGAASGSVASGSAAGTPASASGAAAAPSGERRAAMKRALTAVDVKQLGVAVEDLDDVEVDENAGARAAAPKRARITAKTVDGLPVCEYGTKCYRKNPAHFLEFAHPWLDEENDDVLAGPGAAPPAVSEAPVPSASGSSAAPSAADATIPWEPVPAAPLGEDAAVPRETPLAAPCSIAPTLEFVDPPAPSPAAEKAAPRAVPEELDLRVVALRNLLSSLLSDATRDCERAHFAQLVGLLESGPFGARGSRGPASAAQGSHASSASSKPSDAGATSADSGSGPGPAHADSLPPAAAASPAAHPPAPALERSATPSILEVESGSPPDAALGAAPPAAAVAPAAGGFSETLRAMGFSNADIAEAREKNGTVDEAVEWLLARAVA